jgi:hypothetical protein
MATRAIDDQLVPAPDPTPTGGGLLGLLTDPRTVTTLLLAILPIGILAAILSR